MNDIPNNEETKSFPQMRKTPVVVRAQASKALGSAGDVFAAIASDEGGWNSLACGIHFNDDSDQHVALEIEAALDGRIEVAAVRSVRIHVSNADSVDKLKRFYAVLDFMRKEVKARLDAHSKKVLEFYDKKDTLTDPMSLHEVMEGIHTKYEFEVLRSDSSDDSE